MIGMKYDSNFHYFVNQQNVNDGGLLGPYPKKKGGIGEFMNVSYITN